MENKSYMTVGELAKILNISIRTLQYYDKINLLSPSKLSEGGRRLYSQGDMATLHQIITLKSFGFSLDDIKSKLMPSENTNDILAVLKKQEELLTEKVSKLNNSINAIKILYTNISQTNKINWDDYSKMVRLIQENNDKYWVVNCMDKELLSIFEEQYEKHSSEIQLNWIEKACAIAIEYQNSNISTNSPEAESLAKDWWDMVMKLTNNDLSLLPKLMDFQENSNKWPLSFKLLYNEAEPFIMKALENYFAKNPSIFENFQEV